MGVKYLNAGGLAFTGNLMKQSDYHSNNSKNPLYCELIFMGTSNFFNNRVTSIAAKYLLFFLDAM
jgi:hypothetical protein